jgi:hypothetical protein
MTPASSRIYSITLSERPVPSGRAAVMADRREPPDGLDYFPTPPWATRALFWHALPELGVRSVGGVWEPARGDGIMAAVIEEFVRGPVVASDLIDYGYGTASVDFLTHEPLIKPDWTITNPPFRPGLEFTLHALTLAGEGVAMFVRTQWIESIGRDAKLFRDRPPALLAPFVERVPIVKGHWNPKKSTATSYAWFVWRMASDEPTRVSWIPPGCRRRLTRPDDCARFARPVGLPG